MYGPLPLTPQAIEAYVDANSIGVYILADGSNQARYVGRSDENLRQRLKGWAGRYSSFYFEYARLPMEAFLRECELFHKYGGDEGALDNRAHPACPKGCGQACPRCREFH